MLPEHVIAEILKKFGPQILKFLNDVNFFEISGEYEPTDIFDRAAMAEYIKASKAKNAEVWEVLEKYLLPEMADKGAKFIQIYGLKKPVSVNDIATDYMKRRGSELIEKMTKTDKQKLTNFIWLNSSKNERPLARQILKEPHLGYIVSGHRAATITRTERGRASRSGAQAIADKAGYTYRIRHEVGDHRTRPSHRAIMGEEAAADEPYSNGEMYPGEKDINCRGWEEFKFDPRVADTPSPSDAALEELYS